MLPVDSEAKLGMANGQQIWEWMEQELTIAHDRAGLGLLAAASTNIPGPDNAAYLTERSERANVQWFTRTRLKLALLQLPHAVTRMDEVVRCVGEIAARPASSSLPPRGN